jgi:tetratricopeptide (TPR) repeat protein
MKRISLFLVIACFMANGFAQTSVRQSADDFLKEGKLDKALENINLAVNDPSASEDAGTWIIRGDIFIGIAASEDETYKALDPDPLQQALDSYKKATALDGNGEYKDNIFTKVSWLRNSYYNQAVSNYNDKHYKEAMLAFEKSAAALETINVPDTTSLYYAAGCAELADDKAKAKQLYIELVKQNARSISIYISLADIYRQENDFKDALQTVRDAQYIYPDNIQLLLTETNIYLTSGDKENALHNLLTASVKDASNPAVFYALGTVYDATFSDTLKSEDDRDEAFDLEIDAYKSAIELNPDYYEANYNLGALYVNQAANCYDKGVKLPPDAEKEYERLKTEADKCLEEAIPYLEKALEIQPSDLNTLRALKQIYTRTNDTDKLKIITDKIDAIQRQ